MFKICCALQSYQAERCNGVRDLKPLPEGEHVVVELDNVATSAYRRVLTYPGDDPEDFSKVIHELKDMGVTRLFFHGGSKNSNYGILGKGCVGIVVGGFWKRRMIAVKVRRVDADRAIMLHEGEMLRLANTVSVGPKLFGVSSNVLLMQLIKGQGIIEWLDGIPCVKTIRRVFRAVLEQCWRLDEVGLDHGELSYAPKHILVDGKSEPFIVDFETASINRKVANVTSACQFLFGNVFLHGLKKNSFGSDRTEIIEALKRYKHGRNRNNFEQVLRTCGV